MAPKGTPDIIMPIYYETHNWITFAHASKFNNSSDIIVPVLFSKTAWTGQLTRKVVHFYNSAVRSSLLRYDIISPFFSLFSRGDKAFCSSECWYWEMFFDEAMDNLR